MSAQALILRGCTHHTPFLPLVLWLWPRVRGGWEMLVGDAPPGSQDQEGSAWRMQGEEVGPQEGRGTRLRELEADELKASEEAGGGWRPMRRGVG